MSCPTTMQASPCDAVDKPLLTRHHKPVALLFVNSGLYKYWLATDIKLPYFYFRHQPASRGLATTWPHRQPTPAAARRWTVNNVQTKFLPHTLNNVKCIPIALE